MTLPPSLQRIWSLTRRLPLIIKSPAERYRHAQMLHSIRVAVGILTSILLTTGINVPHGSWATISMLVVIGGLQHHGNIRKKATERALGTMIGACAGLLIMLQFALIGSLPLTYLLLCVGTGICSYHAIGKGGYVALLTAITMCIVAGHGVDPVDIGLWRTANVMIGIVLALIFSFALPLHATYSWRFAMALNMRGIAHVTKRLMGSATMTPAEQIKLFAELSKRLISLRGMMPSVSKETDIPVARLEAIQRQHRAMLSALEMTVSAAQPYAEKENRDKLLLVYRYRGRDIRRTALQLARLLRHGIESTTAPVFGALVLHPPELPALPARDMDSTASAGSGPPSKAVETLTPPANLEGPYWLFQQTLVQIEYLKELLQTLDQETGIFRH